MGRYFAEELEKLARVRRISVKGGRGSTGPRGGGIPLGITQPRREVGAPQVASVGAKIKGFAKRTKSAIKQVNSKKPGWGTLGRWG
jgi:hypothetical protein